jgi:hypothetical protein
MKQRTKQEAPTQLRLKPQMKKRAEAIAEKTGLSLHAFLNLSVAAGIPIVEKNLNDMTKAAA